MKKFKLLALLGTVIALGGSLIGAGTAMAADSMVKTEAATTYSAKKGETFLLDITNIDWPTASAKLYLYLNKQNNDTGAKQISLTRHSAFTNFFTGTLDADFEFSYMKAVRISSDGSTVWDTTGYKTLGITKPFGIRLSDWKAGEIFGNPSLPGTMNGWDTGNTEYTFANYENNEITKEFSKDDEFKITFNDSWAYSWGAGMFADGTNITGSGGNNGIVAVAGDYRIGFNENKLPEVVKFDSKDATFTPGTPIYLDLNGDVVKDTTNNKNWSSDDPSIELIFSNSVNSKKTSSVTMTKVEGAGYLLYEAVIPGSTEKWHTVTAKRTVSDGGNSFYYYYCNADKTAQKNVLKLYDWNVGALDYARTSNDRVKYFANYIFELTDVFCTEELKNVNTKSTFEDAWPKLKSQFNSMYTDSKTLFVNASSDDKGTTLEHAAKRYDVIVGEYGLDNFANREIVSEARLLGKLNISDNSTMIIVVASISLLVIAGVAFIYYRKRRQVQ